jgi:prepilin-type N-terminal cleavage/methylation domain-containing protein
MKTKGFTLIELVVVIVILGILAATAAPKFMDLQRDAKIAELNGVKAAISSALQMVEAKALVKGATTGCNLVCISGDCPQGDLVSSDCIGTAPNNYIKWSNGHLVGYKEDLMRIVDIDDQFVIENPGPSQNICIQFKNQKVDCGSFYSDPSKGYAKGEDANACMVHLWLEKDFTTVEVVTGGC